jgi:hypothetical protein
VLNLKLNSQLFFATLAAVATIAWVVPSHSALFRNSYISFELPPNWTCAPDGTEWVCKNKSTKTGKELQEAIIILTAKEAGPSDTLEYYKSQLSQPKPSQDNKGKVTLSKVMSVNAKMIRNHQWVDGLHYGREIFTYYTRYLGTVKDRIAIMVTFSAYKDSFTKYSADFLKAVESLEVIAPKAQSESNLAASGARRNEMIGAPIDTNFAADVVNKEPPKSEGTDTQTQMILFGVIALAVVILIARRKKT